MQPILRVQNSKKPSFHASLQEVFLFLRWFRMEIQQSSSVFRRRRAPICLLSLRMLELVRNVRFSIFWLVGIHASTFTLKSGRNKRLNERSSDEISTGKIRKSWPADVNMGHSWWTICWSNKTRILMSNIQNISAQKTPLLLKHQYFEKLCVNKEMVILTKKYSFYQSFR